MRDGARVAQIEIGCCGRPAGETFFTQRGHPSAAQLRPLFRVGGHRGRARRGDERGVYRRVFLVGGQRGKDAELLGLEALRRALVEHGHRVRIFQPALEPMERALIQRLHVCVRALGDLQSDLRLRAERAVDAARAVVDRDDAIERKNRVLVRVADQQRTRRDERGDLVVIPAVGVHHEHAVAVPLDGAVHDVIVQRRDARGRRGDLHAIIERRDVPRIRAAAAAPRHADALRIHIGPRHEVVESADAEPRLDPRRSVAARKPPPASL